jgi:hypothetical protein
MVKRVANLVAGGVQVICLLALNDEWAPMFDKNHAAAFAALGTPAFACTPDLFPELMAAASQRQDLGRWVATQGIVTFRAKG